MCGMNLAFDREAIGPAMYFGLMGEGQPWGRYDGECGPGRMAATAGALRCSSGLPCTLASWVGPALGPLLLLRVAYLLPRLPFLCTLLQTCGRAGA